MIKQIKVGGEVMDGRADVSLFIHESENGTQYDDWNTIANVLRIKNAQRATENAGFTYDFPITFG